MKAPEDCDLTVVEDAELDGFVRPLVQVGQERRQQLVQAARVPLVDMRPKVVEAPSEPVAAALPLNEPVALESAELSAFVSQ
jgi:hypothetical protein